MLRCPVCRWAARAREYEEIRVSFHEDGDDKRPDGGLGGHSKSVRIEGGVSILRDGEVAAEVGCRGVVDNGRTHGALVGGDIRGSRTAGHGVAVSSLSSERR